MGGGPGRHGGHPAGGLPVGLVVGPGADGPDLAQLDVAVGGFTYVKDDGRRGFATVNRDGTGFWAPPNDDWPAGVTGLTWSLRNQPVAVTARPPTDGNETHHYDLIFEYGPTPDKIAGIEYAAGEVAGIEVRPGSGEIVFLNEYGVVLSDLSKGIYVQHKIGSGGPVDVERRKLSISPDGAWAAVIVDGNRMLVDLAGGATVALGPATAADMVGPWSADGTTVGYLGRQTAGETGTVTAYRRDGGVAWTRPGLPGDPGFLATGWAGTKLCR